MAAFFPRAAIALLSLCAPCTAVATSVPTIRREHRRPEQVALTASGALLASSSAPKMKANEEFCRDDFPLGKDKTNECVGAGAARIATASECWQAATMAGATKDQINPQLLPDDPWRMKHPKGCFSFKCKDAAGADKDICYFYNPVEYDLSGGKTEATAYNAFPDGGQPVCKRRRVLKGSINAAKESECPTGYAVVSDQALCETFVGCMDDQLSKGEDFRIDIQDVRLYNNYPKFCFIRAGDGTSDDPSDQVHFNVPPTDGSAGPTAPAGTPICNVTVTDAEYELRGPGQQPYVPTVA